MKWIVRGLAAIIATVLLVVLIGYLLPSDHVASVEARLAASPDEVWGVLTDVESYPEWRRGVDRVERLADVDGRPVWREVARTGAMTLGVEEAESGRRWVVRILDEDLPFGGTWTYELRPDQAGMVLTITESGSVYNPIFRFASRFIMGHDATMRAWIEDLKARLGEVPE